MRRAAPAAPAPLNAVFWIPGPGSPETSPMTVTHLRAPKSETRDMAERDRSRFELRLGDPEAWHMSNTTFLTAFVAIAAGLAILALVLR